MYLHQIAHREVYTVEQNIATHRINLPMVSMAR